MRKSQKLLSKTAIAIVSITILVVTQTVSFIAEINPFVTAGITLICCVALALTALIKNEKE